MSWLDDVGGLYNKSTDVLKQNPSPSAAANNWIKETAKASGISATLVSGLPPTVVASAVDAFATDAGQGVKVLAGMAAISGLGLIVGSKPTVPVETSYQKEISKQAYTSPQSRTLSASSASEPFNEGYEGSTIAKLGNLYFEVPPAMSTVTSVHGGMGTVAPGAGHGISVRHVQNVSTMLIPGSVPLYQSLGIQGQMVEFVGAFLGFDHTRLHNATVHSKELGSNIIRDDSPNPFYTNQNHSNGKSYGEGNIGAWAVSRAFEMQIRKGEPLELLIDTTVIKIRYSVVVTGFDRMYQRDDRTWYKIQALVVGSAEWYDGASDPAQKPTRKQTNAQPGNKPPQAQPKKKKAVTHSKTETKGGAGTPAKTTAKPAPSRDTAAQTAEIARLRVEIEKRQKEVSVKQDEEKGPYTNYESGSFERKILYGPKLTSTLHKKYVEEFFTELSRIDKDREGLKKRVEKHPDIKKELGSLFYSLELDLTLNKGKAISLAKINMRSSLRRIGIEVSDSLDIDEVAKAFRAKK